MRHDDLCLGIDRGLSVEGLHEAVLRLHDPAFGIGEVLLGFGTGLAGGGNGFRTRLLAAFGLPLLLCRSLLFDLGFGARLRLGFQRSLCRPDRLCAPLLVSDPVRHLLAGLVTAVQLVLPGIGRFCGTQPLGNLRFQLGCTFLHALVAHRLVLGSVRLNLRAVERHMPEFDEPGLLAQLQDLHEQPRKRLQVALAEVRDRAEIRRIKRDNAHEIDTLTAGLGDAARSIDAAAIGIKQQRRHHMRVKRRLALLVRIGGHDLDQIELIHDQAQHETGEMVVGYEVLHRQRQQ